MPNKNFIINIIDKDSEDQTIHTRFPPEPNGYLHIGHAKSIYLNFEIAEKYNRSTCNLRFDDTNPTTEQQEFVDQIIVDVEWLGYSLSGRILFASDYFMQMYEYALQLIKQGVAYVDDQSADDVRRTRGTLTSPGVESKFRNRSIDENLDIFEKMKNGHYKNGEKVLRAKIDMSSPNLNLRDPVMYRILHASHHRTKDDWCIYPMYDWAHGIEDSIENISHSLCSLEFEDHRPLYDWFLNQLQIHHPKQIEFGRLNLTHTLMSKRKLAKLVKDKVVDGWDDPRMPTISGLRRRGYTPQAIKAFLNDIGVTKHDGFIDYSLLEFFVREDLNKIALRVMGVLDPLEIEIVNYPEDKSELLLADNNPEDKSKGTREIPFSKYLYIEKSDFMEDAPKKYFRLTLNNEVRLKHAYYITCKEVVKDSKGSITKLLCEYDPSTRGGWSNDGRKVKGTLHWVSKADAIDADINIYEHLFDNESPDSIDGDFIDSISKISKRTISNCKLEPSLRSAEIEQKFQFIRLGYFCLDSQTNQNLTFNRTISLRDSWAKKHKGSK